MPQTASVYNKCVIQKGAIKEMKKIKPGLHAPPQYSMSYILYCLFKQRLNIIIPCFHTINSVCQLAGMCRYRTLLCRVPLVGTISHDIIFPNLRLFLILYCPWCI